MPGDHGQHAPADPTLGRQPDPVGELAGGVVSTAGQHDRVHSLGVGAAEQPPPVHPQPVLGQEQPGQGEVAAARLDGAVRVVVVQHPVDRVLQVAVAGDEMGDGSVTVALLCSDRATTQSVSSFGFPDSVRRNSRTAPAASPVADSSRSVPRGHRR